MPRLHLRGRLPLSANVRHLTALILRTTHMDALLALISVWMHLGSAPTCTPHPSQLPPFDSTQVAHLVGQFHITAVDTTTSPPQELGTDLVIWVNDSVHRYRYMKRGIGIVHGERPFGGSFRSPGRPWIDPETAWEGILYHPGSLYLGTIGVNDGGGTTLTLNRLGPAGFSGRWTADMGIAVIFDTRTNRYLPNPAGYYCAWRVAPFPDSPKPNSPGGA